MDGNKEYLDVSLFKKCELQEFFKQQKQIPDIYPLDNLSLEESMQSLSLLHALENYGFELLPWKNTGI